MVFHEGDPVDALFVIEKGCVAIRVTTPLGEVATLTVLGLGGTFGGGALLEAHARRTATVVAREPTETFSVSGQQFTELRASHPQCPSASPCAC